MSEPTNPSSEHLDQHLSQLATAWTVVRQAHAVDDPDAAAALEQLWRRYEAAVYRYLLASVRDRHAADDLFQEFALRFARGDFQRANPQRGRFRDFLKTSLYHLLMDHHRRRKRDRARPLTDAPEPADEAAAGRAFDAALTDDLLNRAWAALAEEERKEGRPWHTVLRFRSENPHLRSPQLAVELSGRLGKDVTADWVRKRLMQARDKFADLLVQEAARGLGTATEAELQEELAERSVLDLCQEALQRRGARENQA